MVELLGNRIRLARLSAKLSQKDIADYFGVKSQTVSHWETGKTTINVPQLFQLAELLKVKVDYLLGFIDFDEPQVNELREDPAPYGIKSPAEVESLQKEIQLLIECKSELKKRIEIQAKLINAYEAGYTPQNVPQKMPKRAGQRLREKDEQS